MFKKILILLTLFMSTISCAKQNDIGGSSVITNQSRTDVQEVQGANNAEKHDGYYYSTRLALFLQIKQNGESQQVRFGQTNPDEFSKNPGNTTRYSGAIAFDAKWGVDVTKWLDMKPVTINKQQFYYISEPKLYIRYYDNGDVELFRDESGSPESEDTSAGFSKATKDDFPNIDKMKVVKEMKISELEW